jgi:predicted nucleotidyltransferase
MLLKSKYRKILLDIFSELSIPVEVWAYGSRVKGTAHDGSDLDLVILTSDRTPIPIDLLLGLKDKIRNSNIPILVELFDWARLPESFHKNIEACHEIFYNVSFNFLNEESLEYNKQTTEGQTND